MLQILTIGFFFSLFLVIHIRYKALAELPDWDEDVPPCTVEGDCSEPLGDEDNGNSFVTIAVTNVQEDMRELLPVLQKTYQLMKIRVAMETRGNNSSRTSENCVPQNFGGYRELILNISTNYFEGLVCYDFLCYGDNCLHGNITEGSSAIRNCTIAEDEMCYITKRYTEYGLRITAGCASHCEFQEVSIPTGMTTEITTHDMSSTSGIPFLPKRRRKRSSDFRANACCNSALCNHDSPCGERHCEKEPIVAALVCFTFYCTGEGCLYDAILRNDLAVLTCEAEENSGCFIRKEQTSEGLSVTAGCGPPCITNVDPGPSGTTGTEPMTKPVEFRRRRSTSFNPTECCSTPLCNHDSPCGNLSCVPAMPVKSNPLVCYDVQCNGEGCLYAAITSAEVPTCYATGEHVCYVEEERLLAGVSFTASCGLDCDISTTTDQFITTTVKGDQTTTNTNHLPPYRRRKRSENAVTNRECCNTSYCNHNSPCGGLTCGTEYVAFKTYSTVLMLAFFSFLYQC